MSLRERLSQLDRATAGQLTLLFVGIGLLAVAPSAEPPSGTFLELETGEPRDAAPENASVVDFQDMPPEAQDAFRTALADDEHRAQLSEGASVLSEYDYIRYQGGYYEYYLVAVDSAGLGQVLLVGGLGVVAIGIAGLWRLRGPREYDVDR